MPEHESGKPAIKPKPACLSKLKSFTNEKHINVESQDSASVATSSGDGGTHKTFGFAPQPKPRKSKPQQICGNEDGASKITTLQQTRPPDDMDTILMIPTSKSVVCFEDEIADDTVSDLQMYSTIPRTLDKKIFKKYSSVDAIASNDETLRNEVAPDGRTSAHHFPSLAKVCWKSEEVLTIGPVASIDNSELCTELFASLDDVSSMQHLARIEPSPERFLDDILRKRRSLKSSTVLMDSKSHKEDQELLQESERLSNVILVARDDEDESDHKKKTPARQIAEYANLCDGKKPFVNDKTPFYANLQPADENEKKISSPEELEQIKRMNLFFGVKKDTKTDLETEVFNSILSGNILTTRVHPKGAQQQRGRRRLSHLRSRANDAPTSQASGQLLQDLVRVKRSAGRAPLLNRKNKSTDDLLDPAYSNQNFIGCQMHSYKSMDWLSWKHKFIKGMKRHFKGTRSQEAGDDSSVVVATFGVPLEMCPMSSNNKHIPAIVEFCVTVIENFGISSQGIYRIPGNNASVNGLLSELNKDPDSITFENERWQDVNVIGSLLKLFFRKLPEPLMVADIYDQVLQTAKCRNREKKLLRLKLHLLDLPTTNRETFKYLANHLRMVASNHVENKMNAHNLAIMFGPSLVHPQDESTNQMLSDMKYQTDIVENIIKYCDWMFSDWTTEANVPPNEGGSDLISDGNPQLLANAEAILAMKAVEPESPEETSSLSFFRQGLVRLSSRRRNKLKSGKSDIPTKVISNSEREVRLEKVDLDSVNRSSWTWMGHAPERLQVERKVRRNLTQKYALNELEISAPIGNFSAQTSELQDESKTEQDVFSSIKRYPAYSFKNTTITGSNSSHRINRNKVPVDTDRPIFSQGSESPVEPRTASDLLSTAGVLKTDRNVSVESETSDNFNWMSRKESFIVTRPEGRSYFVPINADPELFSCPSETSLSHFDLIQELEGNSETTTNLRCMGRRKPVPCLNTKVNQRGDLPLLGLASSCLW